MNTVDYLNALRKHTKTGSDYAVAKLLGASTQKVSGYKNKGITFSDEMAIKVAHILEIPEASVMADMHAERANCTEVKAVWERAADALRKCVVVALAVVIGLGATHPAPAEAAVSERSEIYIMRTIRRWLAGFLDGFLQATGSPEPAE